MCKGESKVAVLN